MISLLLSIAIFLSPTDPRLNEESEDICPCDIAKKETQELIDRMLILSEIGPLAAPQIGIQKSVVIIHGKEFLNPHILWESEEQTAALEECISTGPICGLVPRAARITVQFYNRNGHLLAEDYSGPMARLLQHEIDHLDGIRFPDRIEKEEDLNCPRAIWLQMKNGLP